MYSSGAKPLAISTFFQFASPVAWPPTAQAQAQAQALAIFQAGSELFPSAIAGSNARREQSRVLSLLRNQGHLPVCNLKW